MIELTFNSAIAKILKQKKLNTSSPIVPGEIYTLIAYHDVKEISASDIEDIFSTEDIVIVSDNGTITKEDSEAISLLNNITGNDFLRVWVDKNDENDLSGLYFVCNTLRDKQTPIIAAYIPEYTDNDFSLLNVDYIPIDRKRKMTFALIHRSLKKHTTEE